jgi:hypothetical protein
MIFGLLAAATSASAQITYDFTYHFRNRSIGLASDGDVSVFGIVGLNPAPGAGTVGTYSQGGVSGSLFELTFNPRQLEGVEPFVPANSGAWTFNLSNGSDALTVSTTPLLSSVAMPFVTGFAVSGNGLAPMLRWQLPTGSSIGSVVVSVLALSEGWPRYDVLLYEQLGPSATSFEIPAGILQGGQHYTLAVNLFDDTFSQRSSTGAPFVPFEGMLGDQDVFLPTSGTGPDGEPTFVFLPVPVTAGVPILIDPVVVEGYDYAIGDGDPLFASVVLPQAIGDGVYELSYGDQSLTLEGGVEHVFLGGGVAAFSVRGIEPGAALSPADPTAFVTELTFVTDGTFTGTMTPVTVEAIPEPGTWALMATGLLGLVAMRIRNGRRSSYIVSVTR